MAFTEGKHPSQVNYCELIKTFALKVLDREYFQMNENGKEHLLTLAIAYREENIITQA